MNTMLLAAAAALGLAAENLQAKHKPVAVWNPPTEQELIGDRAVPYVFDVRRCQPVPEGTDLTAWDGTLQYWTEEARFAGKFCAFQSWVNYLTPRGYFLGIWEGEWYDPPYYSENDLEINHENVAKYFDGSMLYLERQKLIEACLVDTYINQHSPANLRALTSLKRALRNVALSNPE